MKYEYNFSIPTNKPKVVKKVDIGYAYTTFLAFLVSLKCDDKRRISIKGLKKYRPLLFREFKEINDNSLIASQRVIINDINDFEEVIKNYQEYFIVDGEDLVLKDDITIDDLEDILDSFNIPQHDDFLYSLTSNSYIKRVLGINVIKEILSNFAYVEGEIAKLYIEFGRGYRANRIEIKEYIEERNKFYYNMLTKGEDFFESCLNEMIELVENDAYGVNYPIDISHRVTDETIIEADHHSADEVLCSPYFFAMFTNINLGAYKTLEDITTLSGLYLYDMPEDNPDLSFEERFTMDVREKAREYGKFIYTARDHDKTIFYMTVIRKLRELEEIYGTNANIRDTKAKLLFLLDDTIAEIYDEDNFESFYKKEMDKHYQRGEVFAWWYALIEVIIPELFEKEEDNNIVIKKLAIAAAYYELTKDSDVIELLNGYSTHINYKKYSSFILNKEKTFLKI